MSTLVPTAVAALLERCRRDVDEGLLPAVQVAIAVDGEIAVAETYGDATDDTRFHTYSAVKPITSLTVMALAEDGRLDLDAPVAAVIDEFGSNDKHEITISQVLLHISGFPHAPMAPALWSDAAGRRAAYARWRTNWEPGSQFEYHASAAHWVLADLIAEVTGRPHHEVVHETITEPLGLDPLLGPDATKRAIADVVSVGEVMDPQALAKLFGLDEVPLTEVTDDALLVFNDPDLRAAGHPGGGGLASATDMALLYQGLMTDGSTAVPGTVLEDARSNVRTRFEDWMGIPVNRTHAFVVAGDDGLAHVRGYGHTVTPSAFGHGGAKGQRAFADPARRMSFALMTNGLDRDELQIARRASSICSKIGACFGD